MYKAVLVDDETYDLEGMRKLIPWEELNIEVVCCENKPLAALRFIENHEIDILVTDIKMPVLSGLELAKRAAERNPQLKTVFISGYQDFHYAKQALHLKAEGYVLKPVDDHEFVAILKELTAQLDAERTGENSIHSFSFIRHDFILHLLEGSIEPEQLRTFVEAYRVAFPQGPIHAALIEIDGAAWKQQHLPESEQAVLATYLQQTAQAVERHRLGYWCKLSPYQLGLVFTQDSREIEQALTALIEAIGQACAFTVTVSYGHEVNQLEAIHRSFKQAQTFMAYKMFHGNNRLLSPHAVWRHAEEQDAFDVNQVLDRLFSAMANYRLVQICDCIEELFRLVSGFEHPSKVYNYAIHIVTKLETYLHTLHESFRSLLGLETDTIAIVQQFETIADMQRWMRRTTFEISEQLFTKRQSKNRKLFEDIEQYVEERLSGEITLKEAANHFSYSPNHLGFLFKDYKGESFNEYVVKRRMERAKKLLRDHHWKVYEVADQVGYKSLTYFSRTFREMVGLTPGDYRKQR
ncbi:helix-turn-helix domain-containing protein [Xylanibacillus composti]|uniref:DNA-binding response regulator n=1 Tax=Xylanibacillus composti TaxID=1572762 RepID=A0A8J4M4G3_9BACL|nr:helix-turn-helix domain-containing protein [Xylanibacillus composti]MDT9726169.1 helix-turn-helix domain-containing protein [Xylanibacillus composti]GIQ70596.1 DNA-binding response regulator [Xylanibacillus composti]